MADELTTDACSGPLPQRCIPGTFDLPACYSTDGGVTVLQGFQQITRNAECRITATAILDENGDPVVGGVLVACPGSDSGGGGGSSGITVQAASVVVATGVTCLNFVGAGVTVTPGACVEINIPGGGGLAFPILAPNGLGTAPSYSFSGDTDSGLYRAGTSMILTYNNNNARLEFATTDTLLQSTQPLVLNSSSTTTLSGVGTVTMQATGSFPTGGQAVISGGNMNGDAIRLFTFSSGGGIANIAFETGGAFPPTLRWRLMGTGAWEIGGSEGTAGQVLTSNGAAVPPTWQSPAAASVTLDAVQDAVASATRNHGTNVIDWQFNADNANALVFRDAASPRFNLGPFAFLTGRRDDGSASLIALNAAGATQAFVKAESHVTQPRVNILAGPVAGIQSSIDVFNIGIQVATNGSNGIMFFTGASQRLWIEDNGAWTIGGTPGTAGQVLTSNGAGTPPTWQGAAAASPALYRDNAVAATTPVAGGSNAVAIGSAAVVNAAATNSFALGTGATVGAAALNSIAMGTGAQANGLESVAIGETAIAGGQEGVAIGSDAASGTATGTIAIGNGASVANGATNSLAIGNGALISGASLRSIAIGQGAQADTVNEAVAIGDVARATNTRAIAIGDTALAGGDSSVRIGVGGNSGGTNSIAIGESASSGGARSVAIGGAGTSAGGVEGIAIGDAANAGTATGTIAIGDAAAVANGGSGSIAIGDGATVGAFGNSIAMGFAASGSQDDVIAFGRQSLAGATFAIAIGTQADARTSGAVAIGVNAIVSSGLAGGIAIGNGADGRRGIAIGLSASAFGSSGGTTNAISIGASAVQTAATGSGVSIGASASAGLDAVALGEAASAQGSSSVAIGSDVTINASATGAVGIGDGTTIGAFANTVAIGQGTTPTAANQVMLGNASTTEWVPMATNVTSLGTAALAFLQINVRSPIHPGTNITSAASPYAVLATDYAIFVDTTGGNTTVTLPASPVNGRVLNVKKVSTDSNNFTVDGNGKTIDSAASITSAAVNKPNLQLIYDSANNDWRIL